MMGALCMLSAIFLYFCVGAFVEGTWSVVMDDESGFCLVFWPLCMLVAACMIFGLLGSSLGRHLAAKKKEREKKKKDE